MKVIIVGAGNVGTSITRALADAGHSVAEVWSRTPAHAETVANRVGALPLSDLERISPDADCYLFCVKDDALEQVITHMPDTAGIWVHTAGSLPMELFASRKSDHGVLYPLQTFSRQRPLTLAEVPLFIEGSNPETTEKLEQLAATLSHSVHCMPGEKRKMLHLAAVFACNFVNHLYALSGEIIAREDIPFEVLLPLISETAAKVREMTPAEGQTGPATRGDAAVMRQQMMLIEDPPTREIYRLLSESIAELTKRNRLLP